MTRPVYARPMPSRSPIVTDRGKLPTISAPIRRETYEKLQKIAITRGMTKGAILRELVLEYIAKFPEKK